MSKDDTNKNAVSFEDLIAGLSININLLLDECSDHAAKAAGVAFATAEAQLRVRKLNLKLNILKAELDGKIREAIANEDTTGLAEYGIYPESDSKGAMKKPTEGAISNAITLNDSVKELQDDLIMAESYADKIKAISYAYGDKGKQIKCIVDLICVRAYGGIRPDLDMSALADATRAELAGQVDSEREGREG